VQEAEGERVARVEGLPAERVDVQIKRVLAPQVRI
jgi:hypothetical protein